MIDTNQTNYGLTAKQVDALLEPINENRVFDSNGNSYVPGYEVIAHLNYLFGFAGWDKRVTDGPHLVYETSEWRRKKNKKTGEEYGEPFEVFTACYRATVQLIVKDRRGNTVKVSEDTATGVGENQPRRHEAHDKAVKEVVTYGLKRCAKDLGDGFGLSLYNKGSLDPVVGATLVRPDGVDVARVAPKALSMGNDETWQHDNGTNADDSVTAKPDQPGKAPVEPAVEPADAEDVGRWVEMAKRMPQVLGAEETASFKEWRETKGYPRKPDTAAELDALLTEARSRFQKVHGPLHGWSADELGDVKAALAEMQAKPDRREWDDFDGYAFNEFADPTNPETWTVSQVDLFLPWLAFGGPADTAPEKEAPANANDQPVTDEPDAEAA